MLRPALLALTAFTLASAALAQPVASPPPTKGTYTVDTNHTLVRWEVDHFGVTPYTGLFGDATGTLVLDTANPAATRVEITIPVSKVTTASAGLTAHLLRPGKDGGKPDFFGAAPADARFVSTKVEIMGQSVVITGNFTLNGITRPVTLETRFYGATKMTAAMGGKDNVGFEARTVIRRSEFGLNALIPMVSDEVRLQIIAAFEK
jgi:polyisoprenoid-binding protein YceI